MRIIGMDIHRVAAEAVALCDGELTRLGRVPMLGDRLEGFAREDLAHDDHVVIEVTGSAASVADFLAPFVDRVVIANPSVHQSGEGPAQHGRITKQGRGQARGMLVEAAWVAA